MTDFSKRIGKFADKVEKRSVALARRSARDVANEANLPRAKGGRMPVDTGFLRASIRAALGDMPREGSGSVTRVIAQWKFDKPLYIGWTANYAREQEYKNGFVRGAAEKWAQIVERNAKELGAA